jgi:hypothetical protein
VDGVHHSGSLGSWTLLIVLENATFWKLDLFPSSGEGKEAHTILGPLERANLNHWTLG